MDIRGAKSGQAVIEFCIGLVAMLTVIGGIFQLGRMGRARMDARVEATRVATSRSMLDAEMTDEFLPTYILEMEPGSDGYTYSQSDEPIRGNTQAAYDRMVARMQPERVRRHAPESPVAGMDDTLEMMLGMGLVAGTGAESNIPVLPVVRRLFFDRNSVDIHVQVWSTRTGDFQ